MDIPIICRFEPVQMIKHSALNSNSQRKFVTTCFYVASYMICQNKTFIRCRWIWSASKIRESRVNVESRK